MLDICFEDIDALDIDQELLFLWISTVSNKNNRDLGDLTLIFCSDEYILNVNNQYLSHDYFTDIITFNYNDSNTISGDLFISVDTVKSNANLYNSSFKDELNRVIIHGVLHLIGFDDKTDADQEEMTKQENLALKLLSTL